VLSDAVDLLNASLGFPDAAVIASIAIIGIGALGVMTALLISWIPESRAWMVGTASTVVLALGLAGQIVLQAKNLPTTGQVIALLLPSSPPEIHATPAAADVAAKAAAEAKRPRPEPTAAPQTSVASRLTGGEVFASPFDGSTGSIARPPKKAAAVMKSRAVDEARVARAVNGMSRHLRNVTLIIADDPETQLYAGNIAVALGRQGFSVAFEDSKATATPAGVLVCARQPTDLIVFRVTQAAGIATRAVGPKEKNWATVCDPAAAITTAFDDEFASALLTTGTAGRTPQKTTRIFVGQRDRAVTVVQRPSTKRATAQD
jgi:hypothetical protein